MSRSSTLRVVQASPADPTRAIETAWLHDCQAIAWDLRENCSRAVEAARAARLRSEGWYRVSLEPDFNLDNPEVARIARRRLMDTIRANDWCAKVWLADIQAPPMTRESSDQAWPNPAGRQMVPDGPFDLPNRLSTETFFEDLLNELWQMDKPVQVSPILNPALCAADHCPEQIERFRSWAGSMFVPQVGLLLMSGTPAPDLYGSDLFPCIAADDAGRFENCLILLDSPYHCNADVPAESALRR